ncbi:GatB/YqeY domain-containing protein [Candidatus Saccharibacteria bacterium]|nr:GatB/YqeY domain-containing protein [Candidatus Saccharibacteria bacterium]
MTTDQVNQDLIAALKAGQKPKAEALRLLKSSFTNARIALGHELDDAEAEKVIRKEIKSRIEARDIFRENDRSEQADKEEFERQTYAVYVKEDLTDLELSDIVKNVLIDLGDNPQFGQAMGLAVKQVAGRADGKRLSEEIKKQIQEA